MILLKPVFSVFSHPEITELFNNGAILIRRTPTRLLRNAVDFILEQTINAGAAIGSSGKHESHHHDHFSFGKKSYSIRTRIISNILDYIGLNHQENVSKVTKSHRIKKILQSFEFNCGLNQNLQRSFHQRSTRLIQYCHRKGCLTRNFKFSPKHS